jgi:hypothetical protein
MDLSEWLTAFPQELFDMMRTPLPDKLGLAAPDKRAVSPMTRRSARTNVVRLRRD